MKRSLLICLSLFVALAALTATVLAMESRSDPALNQVEAPAAPAQLAVVHLAPFSTTTAVTVELDGGVVYTNFKYGDGGPYNGVSTGSHTVTVYLPGSATPVLSKSINLDAGSYTAIAVGGTSGWDLDLELLEDVTATTPGTATVRLGHLAPFTDTITGTMADVRLQDGSVLLPDVAYRDAATYTQVPPDIYDVKITGFDGYPKLIDPMPAAFGSGDNLSVFATGDGVNQDLQVFVLPSGQEGFFLAPAAGLQVAHLAPFARDPNTAVTITLDSTAILTGFEFAESTGYVPITATGGQLLEVLAGGTPVLSATLNLSHAMDYTAIAVGDGANQPLGLQLLPDDNMPPPATYFKVRMGHLAPFSDTITGTLADVRLQDDSVTLVPGVGYGTVTPAYMPLPAARYDLKVTARGGYPKLIDPMPAVFSSGDIASVFAVGDGVNQPLGIFALPAGAPGQLLDLAAALQVAHLAPFAMDPGTAVTITLDSTAILTGFEFADSTGYVPIKASGGQLLEILAGGSPVLSTTLNLSHAMDYTAIAVGDADNQPLGLQLLNDDNSPPSDGSFKIRIGHLAPFASTMTDTVADVRLQDGTPILPGVAYGAVVPTYTELVSGTYDLKITAPGGTPTLIDPYKATFVDGDIFSVFAVGDGMKQDLGVFALPSGEPGALLPLTKYVYFPIIVRDYAPQ